MAGNDKPLLFSGGAGVLVLARDTGRFLALKRSDHVQHGRTWAVTGGLIDPGETPAQAAAREMREETNYSGPPVTLVPLAEFHAKNGFTYTNYLAVVDHEFQPSIDHENEGYKWVDSLDDWPAPVHFGIEYLKQQQDAMAVINAAQKEVKAALVAPPKLASYPPTLFHVEPAQKKGEDIKPYKGRVHATENPREAMASLTPKDVRIANKQLPGSEDFITIIENRDEFLKNRKFEGVISILSGEDFNRKPAKDGSLSSHWIAANAQPVSERNFFDKIRSVEDVMYYGVHVLFTPGPVTAEERAKIIDAVNAPDCADRIKKLVSDGTLIYENAARDIHVSPQLQPDMTGDAVRNKPNFVRRNRSMKPRP